MFTQKNNLTVWVGKDVTDTAAATLIDNYSDLNDTEIALIDITTNKTIQDAASIEWVRFVYRNGTQLIYSPIMKGAKMIKTKTMSYVAPKEQITYVGWNGASGAMEVANSKLYLLKIQLVDAFKTFGNKIIYKTLEYKSDASATQAEIVDGLYDSFLANYSHEAEQAIKMERTATVDSIAAFGTATVYGFTNGSPTVTTWTKNATQTSALTASTASVTAGQIIGTPSTSSRTFVVPINAAGTSAGSNVVWINTTSYAAADAGDASANGDAIAALINAGTQATAVNDAGSLTITLLPSYGDAMVMASYNATDGGAHTALAITYGDTIPVAYKVATTSNAATFTLDQPWQGPTSYLWDGATSAYVGVVTNAGGVYGLKITGVARTNFQAGVFKYLKNRFKVSVTVDGYASTSTITYSQVAREGQGAYEQIAELEWFAAGNRLNYGLRELKAGDTPFVPRATAGKTYECLSFTLADDNDVVTLTGASPKSLTEFIFAYEKDSHQGDQMVTSANTIVGMTDFASFS